MKAVGYYAAGPIERSDALVDLSLPDPVPAAQDLIVRVRAVSVNPVDTKIRAATNPARGTARVLGFDAAEWSRKSDQRSPCSNPVMRFFMPAILRAPAPISQFHAVDERLVGRKPRTIDWASAAALPLTSITAWEALFDRLDVRKPVPGSHAILIVGSGGVGSVGIQLAKVLTDLTVITTAAMPQGEARARGLGADYVIDYRQPLADGFTALGIDSPGFVFSTTHTDEHLPQIVRAHICAGADRHY